MSTKQVIVVRRDLRMPAGKIAAQVAHASMAFLTSRLLYTQTFNERDYYELTLKKVEKAWLDDSFAKVVLGVDREEDLFAILERAHLKKVEAYLITDDGRTCFNGVRTHTCVGIGPDDNELINSITGHLKLL